MKNSILYTILTVILVVAGIGVVVWNNQEGSVTSIETSKYVKFLHGAIVCTEMGASTEDSGKAELDEPLDISCQKTFKVTTPTCDIKLELRKNSANKIITYDICDFVAGENLYTSTKYENCIENTVELANLPMTNGNAGFLRDEAGSQYLFQDDFDSSKVIRIKDIDNPFWIDDFEDNADVFLYYINYRRYGLRRTDAYDGYYDLKTENCMSFPGDTDEGLVIQASDSNEYKDLFKGDNYLYAGGILDYISQPIPAIIVDERLKMIDGALGYCDITSTSSRAYYALEEVTLYGGDKYYYLSNNILETNVECCNGEYNLGFVCVDENWVDTSSKIPCSEPMNPCPIKFDQKYSEGYVYHQECINNFCEIVTKKVDCTDSKDCTEKDGGICTADYTCFYRQTGCVQDSDCLSGEKCINGGCTSDINDSYLWWFVGGLVIFILIIVIIALLFKGRGSSGGTF